MSVALVTVRLCRISSDLLFTAPLDGRDAYVYLLVEHQSSLDPLMAFRMLRYVTRIWDQYLRGHPKARQPPAVIPLVVHVHAASTSQVETWTDRAVTADTLDQVFR